MKREKLRYNLKTKIIISVLAVFLASLMTIPVFAWMINKISFDYEGDFKGSSIIAYFAGGDGTPEKPYQITKPVHLYNLSWLQYLGIFNRDEDGDGKIDQQYYFVLNNDINMSGLVIPPIGTDDNPFIGNFNGKGHCISNATVSNYVSKAAGDGGVQQKPAAVEQIDSTVSDASGKAIVGFFGVVGDWNYALDGKITDESKLTIENKVNKVYDFRLDKLTIRTDTDESLIGLLAGYVNGSLVNVGIGESYIVAGENVTPLTGVTGIEMQLLISRYSLIGEYDHESVVWPDEPILGGWGESLALETMFTDLRGIYDDAQFQKYISEETFTYRDGVQISHTTTESTSDILTEIDLGSAGNYVFSRYAGSTTNSSNITYLYGESTWSKKIINVYLTARVGDYIYSGTNYLSLSSQNAVTSGTAANSVAWSTDEAGHLYTVSNNGTKYYLNRNSSNNLTISTNASTATVWKRENVNAANTIGRIYCTVNGVNYYIYCDSGTWRLNTVHRTVTTETGYTIASGSNYLNLDSNGELTSDTYKSTATLWTFSNTNSRDGRISAKVDNTTYYLSTPNNSLTTTTNQNDSRSWTNNSNVLYYGNNNNSRRYLRYNNNAWGLSKNNSTTLTITYTEREVVVEETVVEDFNLSQSLDQTVEDRRTTTETVKYTTETNATWFPLLTETDENNKLTVSSSNTGYVVSSSDFQNDKAPDRSGSIRVSRYTKNSSIQNSLSSGNSLSNRNLSHNIYSISYKNPSFDTIGSEAQAVSKFGFQKYADVGDTLGSFSKLKNTLSGKTYVYGLHFMKSTIRMDNKITIDGAKVVTSKGLAYYETGYELPRNAITFNLPEAGYINFFAGTYFSGNTSFFSLYSIERSGDGKITAIREISKIYGVIDSSTGLIDESKEYVYSYTDGTYSDTLPSDYKVVFDTTWITAPDMNNNYVYYFEIPVNEGEFALGSVEGSDGAYLIYLDLAANGTRRVASEPTHEITGINFVDDAGLDMDTDIQDYPIVAFSIEMANGTDQHAGVTAGFDRQSATSMNQSLSGPGSASFTAIPIANNKVTITQTTSMVVDRISPQAFSLSRRRDEDILI